MDVDLHQRLRPVRLRLKRTPSELQLCRNLPAQDWSFPLPVTGSVHNPDEATLDQMQKGTK